MVHGEKVDILLVDDRHENFIALEAVLASPKYHLVKASCGEEALKYVLQYDFAVILLDVQMPGLNGFETAELIKQRKTSMHIPIIFITALSKAKEHVSKGYSAGAVDYIFKPFNPSLLRSKVDAFVEIYKNRKDIQRQHRKLEEQTSELKQQSMNLEAVIEDKTKELLKANEDLRVSQESFRKIFQSSPNLMAIRSVHNKHYLKINKIWSQFTGYMLEDLNETNDNLLQIKPNSPDRELKFENKPLDLIDRLYNQQITYVTKEKVKRDGLLSTEHVYINGEPCIISVITDITESLKLQKEITRLDRLNLVGEMAAGIAHEIRNPMTTVLGFLQLSKRQQEFPTPMEYIDLMIGELERANGIITEFLALAKDKATDPRLENLNEIIHALHPLLQAEGMLGNKNVNLDLEDCPLVYIDEKEIRQLILNIALNGLEAMPLGGQLIIRTYVEGDKAVLKISDDGPGITPDILENIGTPFFTTKEKGTGLGLAICYSIAARNQANIEIETSSEGTTFIISFQQSFRVCNGNNTAIL
ncbi:response regulator [Alkalihalobacterium alkalinitrilicum]|uniref:ATP-binding response regulator n=1 Tax=Alkalihalobacterium alkalinitrilicum TaxID=427920 RepID=UPI0009954161|nr:response regulator [Alkalihalobacterium alkalinitrilicum]